MDVLVANDPWKSKTTSPITSMNKDHYNFSTSFSSSLDKLERDLSVSAMTKSFEEKIAHMEELLKASQEKIPSEGVCSAPSTPPRAQVALASTPTYPHEEVAQEVHVKEVGVGMSPRAQDVLAQFYPQEEAAVSWCRTIF